MTALRLSTFAACIAALLSTAALPSTALALDADQALTNAAEQISSVSQGLGAIQTAIQRSRGTEKNASQRIADAVLLMGSKDYARAIDVLNLVVEKYPNHPTAYPDALALLGETYFRSKQLLSARRTFMEIVARGGERRFADLQVKALGRLVDVTLRSKDFDGLDKIFALMGNVPAGAATVNHAIGK